MKTATEKRRALEGLVWPQFDHTLNVIRPFNIPHRWRRIAGLDHGRRNPTAVSWWAVDYEGNLICYRDYEMAGPTPAEHARELLRLEQNEHVEYRKADPSIFAKNQIRGDKWWSIAEEYAESGYDLEPGDNAMRASLNRCGTLLWPDPKHPFPSWHPRAGQLGSPRAFFLETCEQSIEEVSAWKFKDFRGQGMGLREEQVDVDDHLCDCFRYVATSFPEASVVEKPKKTASITDWKIARQKRIGRQLRRAAMAPEEDFEDEYL